MFGQILEDTAPYGCGIGEHGGSEIGSHTPSYGKGRLRTMSPTSQLPFAIGATPLRCAPGLL